ncbi:Alpha/beta hydrolase fold precursor [Bradyrhizobium sp. STM 3843]|uniref:alpha/beta fold hydrolase n=1 Tax=Bradyrhizobium sp. STM 3843 TaxID=551947 RepID=UPI0002403DB1|nr:alpha/beta hydrolase [Bradyrhizobium sp. STM 3843]CCE12175.1 Alpha/beta hydrolase fold precursor [Bradyrhizobium sp. STM 3843]
MRTPGFFPGFDHLDVDAGGVRFAGVVGGVGPPLLLLHGYPETHIAWRKVAPALARDHTLIIPDLPGYGASRTQTMVPRWTKRRVGAALVALMRALGHERFALAGHDRGARAGYRLVLDHPGVVSQFASLTVVPTVDAMAAVDYDFARKAYHWFLFAQRADLPERLLAAAPDAILDHAIAVMNANSDSVIEPAARDAYHRAFRDPAVQHAICEDYRAALDEDLAHDQADCTAGRRLDCPVLVLCSSAQNVTERIAIWKAWADDVTGIITTGDHLQPEDRPEEVIAALASFFSGTTPG